MPAIRLILLLRKTLELFVIYCLSKLRRHTNQFFFSTAAVYAALYMQYFSLFMLLSALMSPHLLTCSSFICNVSHFVGSEMANFCVCRIFSKSNRTISKDCEEPDMLTNWRSLQLSCTFQCGFRRHDVNQMTK